MKLLHLSDLHLGKRLNEFSLLEDQEYILKAILKIADEQKPDGVIIAGDVYDKSVPSAEAVELFDNFLYSLSAKNIKVFVISGNHDSAERIAFGGRLMDKSGIYMSPVFDGKVCPITLSDDFGKVNFYLLPFIKPAHLRRFFPNEDISTYTEAMRLVTDNMNLNTAERNLLITHQFVTGSERCDSEEISVGGSDNVDASVFEKFDYVALGHIHKAQRCGSDYIRYCGTPLKYSFSEADDNKSVTVVNLQEKGNITLDFIPLTPLRDMVEIRGSYNELTLKSFYENKGYDTAYMHVTLTDEEDIPNVLNTLRVIYKNIMKLDYDNKRTRSNSSISGAEEVQKKSPLELFCEFYELQNGQAPTDEQLGLLSELIEKIWEAE